jgi:hypothetical protein
VPDDCSATVPLELPTAVAEPVSVVAVPSDSLVSSDSLCDTLPSSSGSATWTLDVVFVESLATVSLFPVSASADPELEISMLVLLISTWAWALDALNMM